MNNVMPTYRLLVNFQGCVEKPTGFWSAGARPSEDYTGIACCAFQSSITPNLRQCLPNAAQNRPGSTQLRTDSTLTSNWNSLALFSIPISQVSSPICDRFLHSLHSGIIHKIALRRHIVDSNVQVVQWLVEAVYYEMEAGLTHLEYYEDEQCSNRVLIW